MDIKNPTTYQEQVDILRNHGCVISDEDGAVDFLKRVNYYRFSGYFHAFKQQDGLFYQDVTFEKLTAIYAFDQELRALVMKAVSEVELSAKSIISYYHSHKYGASGYLGADSFDENHDHEKFIRQFNTAIHNNRNSQFVKHHLKKYDGAFPLWVATELFTMSTISIFFADLRKEDKKIIAKEYNTDYVHLESWLHSSAVLRNTSAHHGRLYQNSFHQPPKLPRLYIKDAAISTDSLGRQLFMLKLLNTHEKENWNNTFVLPFTALMEKFEDTVQIELMGSPTNWDNLLIW